MSAPTANLKRVAAIFLNPRADCWAYLTPDGAAISGFSTKSAAVEHAAMSGIPVALTDMLPERRARKASS